jgi:hypothetical protein
MVFSHGCFHLQFGVCAHRLGLEFAVTTNMKGELNERAC